MITYSQLFMLATFIFVLNIVQEAGSISDCWTAMEEDIYSSSQWSMEVGSFSFKKKHSWVSLGVYYEVPPSYACWALVAWGYTQIYCVNYVDAISHVAKIGFVWLLVSPPPNLGSPLFQLHVKNAFLHCDLQEEV